MARTSKTIDVDTKTFVRFWLVILGFGLAGLFVWRAWSGLLIVGIALFLTIAIRPLARRIDRLTHKEHTASSSVLAYVLVIGILSFIVAIVGPVVIEQTVQFARQLPGMFDHSVGGWDGINQFGQTIGVDNLQEQIIVTVRNFSSGFVANLGDVVMVSVGAAAQIITNIILVIVLTLFFSIEGPSIVESFWKVMSDKRKSTTVKAYRRLVGRMVDVVSTYVSHQVMVAILDGCVVMFAVLLISLIFGISGELALPMGLIAMVFYLIPMFGPIISCILIPVILTFTSLPAAITFLIFYIIYEQVENNVIAPKVQGGALNLPATIILVAIIIGMNVFGLLGAIIAIPIVGCLKVLFEEWPNLREPDDEPARLEAKKK